MPSDDDRTPIPTYLADALVLTQQAVERLAAEPGHSEALGWCGLAVGALTAALSATEDDQ